MSQSHSISSLTMFDALLAWGALCLAAPAVADAGGLFALRLDASAACMVALTLFVGTSALVFSRRHMRMREGRTRYFAGIIAALASTLALVLTDHLLVLIMAWVAGGMVLARLIGHDMDWAEARRAARRARLTFAATDSLMVSTLVLAALRLRDQSVSGLIEGAATLPSWLLGIMLASIILATLARCAVPPFSSWLLMSATAPTPVSALMHAGLVNAGGYLLIRFGPMIELMPMARVMLVAAGLAGALGGAAIMIVRSDVKRSLAASTVSQMGFMVMTCGLGAYAAALWHIVAHGLFKAWLFLGAGQIARRGTSRPAGATFAGWLLPGALAVSIAITATVVPLDTVSLVPTVLMILTALFALAQALQPAAQRHRAALAGLVVGLTAIHAAGLGALGTIVPSAATALPAAIQLVVLVTILGSLLLQRSILSGRLRLPASIYVRLINAGRTA